MTKCMAHPIPPLPPCESLPDAEIDTAADAWAAAQPDPGAVWIFATGSLIWNPDFPFVEKIRARISGWHRALCLYSITYRGCTERPGLVMGLAPGGVCDGVAFRIDPDHLREAARSLWHREMGHGSYDLIELSAASDQGMITCHSFTPRVDHPQCAFGLSQDVVAETVRRASGLKGPNIDYVMNTVAHLDEMGIYDPYLHALAERITR